MNEVGGSSPRRHSQGKASSSWQNEQGLRRAIGTNSLSPGIEAALSKSISLNFPVPIRGISLFTVFLAHIWASVIFLSSSLCYVDLFSRRTETQGSTTVTVHLEQCELL